MKTFQKSSKIKNLLGASMNQTSKKWDNNSIIIEEQFHDWYHEGLTSQEVALKTSEMYEDYSKWKTAKQKAFAESFKNLEQKN